MKQAYRSKVDHYKDTMFKDTIPIIFGPGNEIYGESFDRLKKFLRNPETFLN